MKHIKLLNYVLILIAVSGCLTKDTLHKAKHDLKGDQLIEVKGSYLDTNKTLIVNFSAKVPDTKEIHKYHFEINLDTVLSLFSKNRNFNFVADSLTQSTYDVHSIYHMYRKKHYNFVEGTDKTEGLVVELKRKILNEGYKNMDAQYLLKDDFVVENRLRNMRYGKMHDPDNPHVYEKNIVFIYNHHFPPPDKWHNHEFMAFIIEPAEKKSIGKYFLLPATVVFDVVMFPFVVLNYLLMLASGN